MKTFDEIVNGNLQVTIAGLVKDEKKESAIVIGLDGARAWLKANGGYASLKADYGTREGRGSQLIGWSIYRVYEGYGHRCCGVIAEAN